MDCLICSHETGELDAVIAPFVCERTGCKKETVIHFCHHCGFVFYDRIPNLGVLYIGYRDDKYQQQRQKFEPNYTPEFNESLKTATPERKALIESLVGDVDSILDYGGGSGQLMPLARHRYVYDPSYVPLVDGVKRWHTDIPVDLVMCCSVLEHVADPVGLFDALPAEKFVIDVPSYTPKPPYIMHEHINFWTPEALRLMTGADEIGIVGDTMWAKGSK